jgi:hypothetical protein
MKTDIEKRYAIVNERNEVLSAFTTQGKADGEMLDICHGLRVVKTETPVAEGYAKAWIDRKPYIADVAATQYFDLTPTWSGLMPALIAAAGNGSQGAIDELMGLAATVDRLNVANKQAK